ncbi:MAG: urease accessory protein UreE [Pseudomonadota bacterium]
MRRSHTVKLASDVTAADPDPMDIIVLPHDERHLRRRRLTTQKGEAFLVDLPRTIALHHGDRFVLDDGSTVEVIAAQEKLTEITARHTQHHAELCWHLGNRHLPAQVEVDRVLIVPDRIIEEMLKGLGATLRPVTEIFTPMRGAYDSAQTHDNHHHHHHAHSHDHDHG